MVDLSHPFTPRMVKDELTRSTLRGPRFRRLLPGIYVAAAVAVTPELMARAAMLAMPPSAWLSHTTSAALQDIPVPTDPRLHVSVPTAADRRLKGSLSLHVRPRPRTTLVRGLPGPPAPSSSWSSGRYWGWSIS